jgi:hypothetical protein
VSYSLRELPLKVAPQMGQARSNTVNPETG